MARQFVAAALFGLVPVAALAASAEEPAAALICGVRLNGPLPTAKVFAAVARIGPETFVEGGHSERSERWHAKLVAGKCPEVLRVPGHEPDLVISVRSSSRTVRAISFRPAAASCSEAEVALSERLGTPTATTVEHVEWRAKSHMVLLSRYLGESCWVSYVSAGSRPTQ